MNLCPFEERVALGEFDQEVDAHLLTCAECAELARELESDGERLAAAPPELAEFDFAAMRGRIRAEVAKPRRRKLAPLLLLAASLLVAVGIGSYFRAMEPTAPPVKIARAVPPAPPPAVVVTPAKPVHKRRRSHLPAMTNEQWDAALRAVEAANDPPIVDDAVKLPTQDPNVIIIWCEETKGDARD